MKELVVNELLCRIIKIFYSIHFIKLTPPKKKRNITSELDFSDLNLESIRLLKE